MTHHLGDRFWSITDISESMDSPDIPAILRAAAEAGLAVDPARASYFLGRETLDPSTRDHLGPFEERLFISMSATATDPTAYFGCPPTG